MDEVRSHILITSTSNKLVKSCSKLRDKRERRKQGRFAVEGAREILHALRSGFQALEVFFCETLLSDAGRQALESVDTQKARHYTLDEKCFRTLVVREGSDGVVFIFELPSEPKVGEIHVGPSPLIVIADSLEKPGNLGAILRSLDGAGASMLIMTGQGVDVFNPNVVRASLGTCFSIPCISMSNEDALAFCRLHKVIPFVAAFTKRAESYATPDYSSGAAFVMGTESTGVSEFWLQPSFQHVMIPMKGIADSLNVSVATSVLLYEARRQIDS